MTNVRKILTMAGPILGLVIAIVLFSILVPDRFLSAYNVRTVASQSVIVGLGAIGMSFVMISGGIDLSIGAVIALVSVTVAILLRDGAPPFLAFAAGVALGTGVGLGNGALVTQLRIVPFVVTLGTMGIARGTAKFLAREQSVPAPESWITELMAKTPEPRFLLVSRGVWMTLLLAVLAALVLRRTVFGVHTFAIGSNEATARLCGVRVERVKIAVYAVAGAFAGLAGLMQFGQLAVGDPTTAIGLELDVIAAVVLGGGSLAGGRGSIAGSLLGAFFMAVLANGCTLSGVPTYVQEILVGAIIIIAVALDRVRART